MIQPRRLGALRDGIGNSPSQRLPGNERGVGDGPMTSAGIDYVKAQLTELLTNYGPIAILVLDGYSWRMGHRTASYQELRAHVEALQPNCLILDHTRVETRCDVDIMAFEEPKGVFAPPGNTIAATRHDLDEVCDVCPTAARYVRFDVPAAFGGAAAATELVVGAKR